MTYLLSVDPGRKSAIAVWNDDTDLLHVGRIDGMEPRIIYDLLRNLTGDGSIFGIQKWKVIVEGQWFRLPTMRNGRKVYHSADFKSVSKVVESRAYWIAAAKILCLDTEIIDPGVWIPAMTRGAPGETPDARIKWAVKQRFQERKIIADENAAVLMGIFYSNKQKKGVTDENKEI